MTVWRTELPRNTLFNETLTGLRNYYGNVVSTPKAALTMADLFAFAACLRNVSNYFEHARDWCACLLAFFGLLRIGEYTGGTLRFRHVQVAAAGVEITVLRSKTSLVPVVVSLAKRGDQLCPVAAVEHYRSFFRLLQLPCGPDDFFFIARLKSGKTEALTDVVFIDRVRALIIANFPDRDPQRYAGHSFRRGGATALALAGVEHSLIQRHGRWASDSFRRYLDTTDNAALRLAATQALVHRP